MTNLRTKPRPFTPASEAAGAICDSAMPLALDFIFAGWLKSASSFAASTGLSNKYSRQKVSEPKVAPRIEFRNFPILAFKLNGPALSALASTGQ